MGRRFALGLVAAIGCSFSSAGGGGIAGGDASTGASGDDASSATTAVGSSGAATSAASGDATSAPTTGPGDDATVGLGTGTGTSTGMGTDGTVGSGGEGTTSGGFACTDVLYVAGSPAIGGHDQPFHDVLTSLGASVTVVQDDLSVTADADGMCLVVVSASVTGSDVGGKFRDVTIPVVTWEYAIYDDMQMTGDVIDTDLGPADPEEDIDIVDPAHPLAAGLSGTITVAAPAPGRLSWGVPTADADVVATLPGDPSRATLFAYEPGDAMVGLTAPAARVGFPSLTSPSGATITADGETLFLAALWWAVR